MRGFGRYVGGKEDKVGASTAGLLQKFFLKLKLMINESFDVLGTWHAGHVVLTCTGSAGVCGRLRVMPSNTRAH